MITDAVTMDTKTNQSIAMMAGCFERCLKAHCTYVEYDL